MGKLEDSEGSSESDIDDTPVKAKKAPSKSARKGSDDSCEEVNTKKMKITIISDSDSEY